MNSTKQLKSEFPEIEVPMKLVKGMKSLRDLIDLG
jgi:hypothetical protein